MYAPQLFRRMSDSVSFCVDVVLMVAPCCCVASADEVRVLD
jgi:hypothetical protein